MNTLQAFSMGQANRGRPQRVFDWVKAATIIKERGLKYAGAGLAGDLEWTSGDILVEGEPLSSEQTYCYLSSNWATPVLLVQGEELECWKYESETPGWGAGTVWPPEALAILNEKGQTFEGQAEQIKEWSALPSKEGD